MDFRRLVSSLGEVQFVRFLVAGVVNTAFGLAVYLGCLHAHAAPWLALLVGTVAGVTFNFFSLGAYAFRDLSLRRLPRFVGGYAVTYAVNLAALTLLRPLVPDPAWRQILLTVPMALFSYLLMSRLVFRRPRGP
jgi:putative flippase GtrA